jgi:DNA repair protein RadA/Sms
MGRERSVFACTECGAQQPRWLGRCPECASWSTLVEEPTTGEPPARARGLLRVEPARAGAKPRSLREIEASSSPRLATGVDELDRVLGGGLVPGSVLLLAGEPGVGKSTLALQLAAGVRARGAVVYVTGEESPEQLRLRANRLPEAPEDMWVLAETRVEALAEPWRERRPAVVLVDSIQAVASDRVESAPGSVAQVRECAALLAAAAKASGAALILIGHVTKEGVLAGPRVLEHLVDVVLTFEGDRSHAFRLLRARKNRYGSTREVGVFSMTEGGLEGVANPSELFLSERRTGAPGSCIAPLVEGSRPMLVDRTPIGFDDGRLALLLAVLDRYGGVDLVSRDVYVNVAGGVRVNEPSGDLALALALASSRLDLAVPAEVAACGEVGLGGEVRQIGRLDLRLREAARLGFRRVLVPAGAGADLQSPGAEVVRIADVAAAVEWLRASGVVHTRVNDS